MMKLGEAANRLSRLDVLAPEGVDWALAVVWTKTAEEILKKANRPTTSNPRR